MGTDKFFAGVDVPLLIILKLGSISFADPTQIPLSLLTLYELMHEHCNKKIQ